MTGPTALDDIINAGQAVLLEALYTTGPMTCTEMTAISGLSRTMSTRHLTDLRERELVEHTRQSHHEGAPRQGHPAWIYTLTPAGGRALLRHKHKAEAAAQQLVPPATFTTYGQPYVPPSNVFYRNNGNKHVGRAGVPC